MTSLMCALIFALAQSQDSSPPRGVENGKANQVGRTDQGLTSDPAEHEERDRAKDNDQARGPNEPGSLDRPADSPPQMERQPKAKGSGSE